MDYWIERMSNYKEKRWAFLCCNRLGEECLETKKSLYIGCSCIIKYNPFEIVERLDNKKEGFMF